MPTLRADIAAWRLASDRPGDAEHIVKGLDDGKVDYEVEVRTARGDAGTPDGGVLRLEGRRSTRTTG